MSLAKGCMSDTQIAKNCFEYVRDKIEHSGDCRAKVTTLRASDVLKHQTGYRDKKYKRGTMKDLFYSLQIFYLSILNPSKLFEEINQLPWYQGLLHQWIDEVNIAPQSRVLEMASATGELSAYLSTHYDVTAIDNNPKMVARAKQKYPHIKFEVADALNLPFEESHFDVVVASSLINIFNNKQALLNEMIRVCKEQGEILLLFPLEGFSNSNLLKLSADLELKGFSKMALKMWHKMAKKMSIKSIEELLVEHDFEVLSSKKYLSGMVATVVIGSKK